MNEKNKAKLKKLFTGVAALATTCALVFTPACAQTEETQEEEDENTSTRLDTQLIKNGNFEFYDDNDGTYFISPADNWTGGTNGNSSSSMSGIIDTSKARWDYMTKEITPATLEENDDLASDDENKKDYNGALTDDLPFSDPHTATASDASEEDYKYIDNPFTHSYSYDENGKVLDADGNEVTTYADEDGKLYLDEEFKTPLETSVLMLHNYRKSYYTGTESYYTSSASVSLEASTAAEISVWVKTSDLYFDGSDNTRTEVNNEAGAYIQVATTVGGNALDNFRIENINTKNLNPDGENNGWVEYTIYVEASSFAATTVTVTLGLGDDAKNAPVEGYAFFDDLKMTKYKNGALMREAVEEGHEEGYFDTIITKETNTFAPLEADSKSEFIVSKDSYKTNDKETGELITVEKPNNFNDRYFFIDIGSYSTKQVIAFTSDNVSAGLTVEKTNTGNYVSSHNTGYTQAGITDLNTVTAPLSASLPSKLAANGGLETSEDLLAAMTITDENWSVTNAGQYSDTLTQALKNAATLPGVENGRTDAIVMLSTYGTAYQAEITNELFELGADEYALVSFWVKTSDMSGNTAATVTVKDVNDENNSANFTIDTTDIATVTINDEEDVYDGWVQCFVRVANNTEETSTFKIVVNFGLTTIQGTTKDSYKAGWLALANMSITNPEEDVYGYSSSGSHLATLSLTESGDLSGHYFDEEQGEKNEITEKLAIPGTYTGVNGASSDVINLGKDQGDYDDNNKNESAGLINKDYLDAYRTRDWFSAFTAFKELNNDELWRAIAGDYSVQPLLIVNTAREFANKASAVYNYGYIGEAGTVASSGYYAISVKVKVSKGAVANVYLVDTDPASKNVLGFELPKYTFWYDDDGNVLKKEPAENASVEELKANIAYKLRKDGLYENGDGKLYANIYNLEWYYDSDFEHETFFDADGNQVAFDDLVQGEIYYKDAQKTAYASHYLIAGSSTQKVYKYNGNVDGKPTYLYMVNGVADENKVVYGFDTSVAELRYDNSAAESNPYQFTIDARTSDEYADKWVTVTFYVHGGNSAKQYRLELWSGFRDEETSNQTENSYVLFDRSSVTVDETTYNDLVSYYTGEIIDDYKSALTGVQLPDNDGTIDDYEALAGQKSDKFNYSATYYTYTLYDTPTFVPFNAETASDDATGYAYAYSDYAESLGFLKVVDYDDSNDTFSNNEITMSAFIDYSVLDKSIELSATTDTEESEEEETTPENNANIWLLAASIAIVVAILIAIISIVIRDIVKKSRRKKNSSAKNSFNFNKNKRYVKKYVKANGEAPEIKEENVDKDLLKTAENTLDEEKKPSEETTQTTESNDGAAQTEEVSDKPETTESDADGEADASPSDDEKKD